MPIKSVILGVLLVSGLLIGGNCYAPRHVSKGIGRPETDKGKRWAICIGINDYEDQTFLDLKYARSDARQLGEVLLKNGGFDHVFVMTDDLEHRNPLYPKFRNIKKKLVQLQNYIQTGDLVLFFFSGHGVADRFGEGYLLVSDSDREDLFASSFKVSEVVDWLTALGVRKSLLLVDACRETLSISKSVDLNRINRLRFNEAQVAAVLFATGSGGFSYEDIQGRMGVFTRQVTEGLKGAADRPELNGKPDGIITFSELAVFVEETVSDWALQHGRNQKPFTRFLSEKFGDLALSTYDPANPPLPPITKTLPPVEEKPVQSKNGQVTIDLAGKNTYELAVSDLLEVGGKVPGFSKEKYYWLCFMGDRPEQIWPCSQVSEELVKARLYIPKDELIFKQQHLRLVLASLPPQDQEKILNHNRMMLNENPAMILDRPNQFQVIFSIPLIIKKQIKHRPD